MAPTPVLLRLPSSADAGVHFDAAEDPPATTATANDTVAFDGSKMQRTPQGGLRGPAALTKVGVFKYRHRDGLRKGEIVREYRPADEVFATDSLATLEQAPITDFHPAEGNGFITPENFSRLSKGQVTGVKSEQTHVVADAIIQDAATVKRVLAGERVELSCGYAYHQDWTPGITADGQAYDMIQRNIRYNHVALLPRGGGRQGPDVALRFDSAILQEYVPMIINLDSKDYDLATEDGRKAYHTAMDSKVQAEKTRADKAEADGAVLTAALAPLQAAQAKAVRETLEASARKVLGADAKFEGLTDRQVREQALAARKVNVDGKSEEIVNFAFDNLGAMPGEGDPAMAAVLAAMQPATATLTNSDPVIASWANKWKEPLTASKDRK